MILTHPTAPAITVPCLEEGPIAASARDVVAAAHRLGRGSWASITRAWCVPYLFSQTERIFASGEEPTEALNRTLSSLAQYLNRASDTDFGGVIGEAIVGRGPADAPDTEVKEITGEHYGRLFKEFSSASYWEEPARLLKQRLERNGLEPQSLQGRSVLDAGCGGGRYTVAWRLLGGGRVVGLDVSEINISDARRRCTEANIEGVEFRQGDVLALPFETDEFDVVFSNGVLHHTTDWQAGVSELVRVLAPGGLGWLYLIENPGGLFWDVIEILREVMRNEDRDTARQALQLLRLPANRIFYMLDHVMVPINLRLTPGEIEDTLSAAGACHIRRLARGTDFDRIEHLHRGEPFAAVKYGVGENRYVFSKR